jgi:SPP1 gp7 family putative phage head morphogenesis protein
VIRKDALPDSYWDAALVTDFALKVAPTLAVVFSDGGSEGIEENDLGISFDFLEPNAMAYGKERGAELIGKKFVGGEWIDNPSAKWAIDDTTRDGARALLEQALKEGMSTQDFAARLEESGLFSEARAEMIARTETALAFNEGKLDSFKEADIDRVYVYDGDFDEECTEANGQIWDLDEAEANPIQHPNCERDFRPLTVSEQKEEAA